MHLALLRRVLIPVAVIAAWTSLPVAPAAASPDPAWFWEWSDGSRDRQREVSEADFDTWDRIPALTVASSPRRPGVPVQLLVRHGSSWQTEDEAVTDARGRARLRVNPYCEDGAWCDGTVDYRIRAGRATATLAIDFIDRPSPP